MSCKAGTIRNAKKAEQHEPQPAIDRPGAGIGQQAHERGDARVLPVPQRGDAADAHQPGQQQPRDLLGPGNRPVQDVAADDLQADDGGLRDDEDRDRPLERDDPVATGRPEDPAARTTLTRESPRATT